MVLSNVEISKILGQYPIECKRFSGDGELRCVEDGNLIEGGANYWEIRKEYLQGIYRDNGPYCKESEAQIALLVAVSRAVDGLAIQISGEKTKQTCLGVRVEESGPQERLGFEG